MPCAKHARPCVRSCLAGRRPWARRWFPTSPASGAQKLVDAGYRIVGNMGDQWSDLTGAPEGDRTFKVPDPMYYVG